ncbi:MAG: hypothetical protein AAGF56_04905 [Pseudomonadota bacterium]
MSSSPTLALSTALCAICAAPATADDVTLVFNDTNLTLVGELVAADSASYVIRVPLGDMHVPAQLVTCEGADCPDLTATTDS